MTLRLALLQHDIVWEDAPRTIAAIEPQVMAAADQGAELISLSEMWSCGFSMETARVAERPDGPTPTAMKQWAAQTGSWIAGSFPEWAPGDDRPTNRFLLAGPQGEDYRYAKTKPFSLAGEDRFYAPGKPVASVDVNGVRVTPFVCYDLRFADLFWAAAADTDLFLVPANWPESRRDHWLTLLRARAIENQAFVAGVNRVGYGGGLAYAGDSLIIDPQGQVVAGVEGPAEALVTAVVDAELVARVRHQFPFLADR